MWIFSPMERAMPDQIVIYQSKNGSTAIDVHLEADTVWLTQEQLAALFGRERSVITKHLRNLFREGELEEISNVQNMHVANSDKPIKFYNLEVVISVGYRVKSQEGIRFRQWATSVLRDHLVQGYTANQARLAEKGIAEMRQTVELLARTLSNQELVTETGRDVLAVIVGYAKTWSLLLQYDEDTLALPEGCRPAKGVLGYDFARQAIAELKRELKGRGEATDLFGARSGATRLRQSSAISNRRCLASSSIGRGKRKRHIYYTSLSRIIRSWTATNGSAAFCFFSINDRRAFGRL
jgi:prophage antirepressor-like protein